jgi:hypothetical protein
VLLRSTAVAMRDVLDGTSTTFLAGEISWSRANCYRVWSRGCNGDPCAATKNILDGINVRPYSNNDFNDVSFGSEHPGGCQFVACDGNVRFVSENIDLVVYKSTASRDGKEPQTLFGK